MNALHGKQLIGSARTADGNDSFQATNPATQSALEGSFKEATLDEVDRAMTQAAASFNTLVNSSADTRAALLDKIADGLVEAGDALLERCHQETALPMARLTGGRLVHEMRSPGSWVILPPLRMLPGM